MDARVVLKVPSRRAIGWTLGVAAFLWLGFYLSDVLNPFLLGVLVAYVCDPVVAWGERRGIRRDVGVSLLFLTILVVFGATLTFTGLQVSRYVEGLSRNLGGERYLERKNPEDLALIRTLEAPPDYMQTLAYDETGRPFLDLNGDGKRQPGAVDRAAESVMSWAQGTLGPDQVKQLKGYFARNSSFVSRLGESLSDWAEGSLHDLNVLVTYLLLVPVYTFFLLQSWPQLKQRLRSHLPYRQKERILRLTAELDGQFSAFFRGKLVLCVLKGLVIGVGLAVAGVPFAALLGFMSLILSFVPFLTWAVCGPIALLVSFDPDHWLWFTLWVVGTFSAAEGLEAVLAPVIMGREVGLAPVTLLLSFFVFAKLFGLFGVLLAVPIACVARTLWIEFALPHIRYLSEPLPDDPPEGSPPPDASGARDEGPAPAPAS
ncbi:MAG: AI-2E family transporter [Planctomycetota bacterium]